MTSDEFYGQDQVVLVTGGAGQLGSALCERFDELGNFPVMADLDRERCCSRIEELGLGNGYPLAMDVADPTSVREGFAEVVEEFGRVDALVNNAGIAVFGSFRNRTPEEFDEVMKVNAYGTFFCTKEALKHMEGRGAGSIVNIGSIYGVVSPDPGIYGESGLDSSEVYGASKAAIIQMTKYFAAHVEQSDIRVNAVSPGGILADQDPEFRERYEEKTPMGRMATEEDIVDVIVFLCSSSARYVSGQNLMVDGGFTVW